MRGKGHGEGTLRPTRALFSSQGLALHTQRKALRSHGNTSNAKTCSSDSRRLLQCICAARYSMEECL